MVRLLVSGLRLMSEEIGKGIGREIYIYIGRH